MKFNCISTSTQLNRAFKSIFSRYFPFKNTSVVGTMQGFLKENYRKNLCLKNTRLIKSRYLVITMTFLFFTSSAFAQKLKDKKIEINYVSLPTEKLPNDYKTYSVNVYGSGISTANSNPTSLANSIQMDGFKKLSGMGSDFGHLRISVHAGYVSSGNAAFKSKKNEKKDKEGKVTITYSYWYEIEYTTYTSYNIVDPGGNILASNSHNIRKTMSTTKNSNAATVRKNYYTSLNDLRRKFARDAVNGIISETNGVLKRKFDFKEVKDFSQLYFIKKHKSAEAFEANFNKAKEIFKSLRATTPSSEAKTKLIPVMKFWAKEGSIKPNGDKKLMRIYKAANYNLAIVNFYLDELDTAKDFAKIVIKSEGKDKRSEHLIKRIEQTKELMRLHNVNTLHYVRDLSNAVGPTQVKAFEEEKEELAEENNSSFGSIIMNGEEIKGSVMQDKEATDMVFGENGNTKFIVENSGEMKEYNLTDESISSFNIGDRSFVKIDFSPCAKGKERAKIQIMEEVYQSEKIKLYLYYPSSGTLGDQKKEYAFQKAKERIPISLLDTQFLLLNKGLANYFSDCNDLKTMSSEGGFKMNEDDLIKAARIYSELCE